MTKKLRILSISTGIALLAAVFIFAGCSHQSPLEPNVPQSLELAKSASGSGAGNLVVSTSELITADAGGVIEIDRENYQHLFKVDPYAVSSDLTISVKTSKEQIGRLTCIVFEFGPDGLVFKSPAELDFQIAELNSSALSGKLYYFDPKLGQWVYQGSADVKDGIVAFPISHFSKYAISD